MKEEFVLSEKEDSCDGEGKVYAEEDVKEFIKLLKEEISSTHGAGCTALKFIDKIAGDKLK